MNKWLALVLISFVSLNGCSKKGQVNPEDSALPSAAGADENWSGDSDVGKAGGLLTVNFDYDVFTLDDQAKGILRTNAQILKDKPSVKVQVEGHCDKRGGTQYNLALGEKRANSVRKYLVDLGIKKSRISIVSFGHEKPLAFGDSEADYAKNRRGNFVITSR
jgi:peptidoglycan-associated lipoprotein